MFWSSHPIQGGGYSMPELPLLDRELVHDYLQVSDQDAVECARLREEFFEKLGVELGFGGECG